MQFKKVRFLLDGLKLTWIFILIKLSQFFKVSFVIGSTFVFFSGINIAMPLVGMFAGGHNSILIFLAMFLLRYFLFGCSSLHILAFYMPGFFAAAYFAYPNTFVRLILPIACIIIFILHPVGFTAFIYACLWYIPIIVYFIKKINYSNIFFDVLASTFIAHAVGSVIWIYTVPMNSEVWISLIPLAILERIAFTFGIVLIYVAVMYIKSNKVFFSMAKKCKFIVN